MCAPRYWPARNGPRGGSQGLWVSPGLGRRDMNLGDQIVGGSGDQREELTSGAVLAVESPSRTDGVAPSSYEAPAPPWLWMSSSPGVRTCPAPSRTSASSPTRSRQPLPVPRSEDALVLEGDEGAARSTPELINRTEWMTADAALLTVSQLRCVLWPMALDNTLMVSRRARSCGMPPDSLMAPGSGADLRRAYSPSRHVSTEIADQPSAWARAAKLGATERVLQALPERGQRVAIIGCGTSFYMAQSFADLRERSAWRDRCFPRVRVSRPAAPMTLVALTRSGMTTEVLRLLETLRNRAETHTVAITADPDTPVVELADHQVVLDFADEKSIVQTRFATTSLALWRAWLGEDLTAVIGQGRSALTDPLLPPILTLPSSPSWVPACPLASRTRPR